MIRALVFDFGKVVAFFDHRLVTKRLVPHGTFDPDEFHSFLWGGALEDDYESGRIASEIFLQQVRKQACLRCSDDELARAYADIFWPNVEMDEFIPQLKPHYRLVLASNTSELHSRQFRKQFAATLQHFDAQVLSHEVGERKPSAAFYEHCRQHAGCPAEECVFIDDLLANVDGAIACGWHGIMYTDIADLRDRLAQLGVHPTPSR